MDKIRLFLESCHTRFTLHPESERQEEKKTKKQKRHLAANLAQHASLKLQGFSPMAALFVSSSKLPFEGFAPFWLDSTGKSCGKIGEERERERGGQALKDIVGEKEHSLKRMGKDPQVPLSAV